MVCRCKHPGCTKNPNYAAEGATKALFCKPHAAAGMVDVVSKRCQHPGCATRPGYGTPGLPPSRCAPHRLKGMIRNSNARCGRCREPAFWGTNWIPRSCDAHKQPDDVNYVERPCVSCNLTCLLDATNLCEYCNPESFKTARLAKQNALMAYLDSRGFHGSSTDVTVDGGACGLERPDRVFDLGDKIVIVECDEDQHKGRACLCEQTRMVNLGQAFGGLPVYFVRWNPDDYAPRDDRRLPEEVQKRRELLADFLRDIHEFRVKLPQALTSVIYLYFDDWAGLTNAKWSVLT